MYTDIALVFAVTLLIAVLISGQTQRTFLSTSVLFLFAGILAGPSFLRLSDVQPENPVETTLATLALVSVLFTDGMKVRLDELRRIWRLPSRALLFGMPLTFVIMTVAAHLIFSLSWLEAALIGAILSPTDPVFISQLIESEGIPQRLRHLLGVESGLNDGIVLPVILILLQLITSETPEPLLMLGELIGGVLVGIAVPWLFIKFEQRIRFLYVGTIYEPLNAFAIGLFVIVLCEALHVNTFLAAFSAGITVGNVSTEVRVAFEGFGRTLTELLKLAALFFFGLLINLNLFVDSGPANYIFAAIVLIIARPVAIYIVLWKQDIPNLEKATAAWFGPKGFASIFYSFFIFQFALPNGYELFNILAFTIVLSIVAHSSTDVFFGRYFQRAAERATEEPISLEDALEGIQEGQPSADPP